MGINLNLSRWWAIRLQVHKVASSSKNLIVVITSLVDAKFLAFAEAEALFAAIAQVPHRGCVAADVDLAMAPFIWNCQLVHALHEEGFVPTPLLMKVQQFCLSARNGADRIAMQRNAQLPFPYTQM